MVCVTRILYRFYFLTLMDRSTAHTIHVYLYLFHTFILYFQWNNMEHCTLYSTHTSTIRIIQSNNKLMHNIEFRHSNCMVKAGF